MICLRQAPLVLREALRLLTAFSLAGSIGLCVQSALADSALSNDGSATSYQPPPAQRRDGFTIGLMQHMGLTAMHGYPNQLSAIGDPEQRRSSGAAFGQSGSIWLGGALRDWFTAGISMTSNSTFDDAPRGVVSAFGLHLEAFPAFALGGPYRDLGVFLDVGTGVGMFVEDSDVVADGGSIGHIGVGAFFEPLRFWHFSMGPSLMYSHQFSQSWSSHVLGAGFRFVFYGVQPD